jgi:hypothetical protein
MYRITVFLENPMLGESRMLTYQFDPATLNQAKWDAAFPTIRARVDDLVTSAANPTRPDLIPLNL